MHPKTSRFAQCPLFTEQEIVSILIWNLQHCDFIDWWWGTLFNDLVSETCSACCRLNYYLHLLTYSSWPRTALLSDSLKPKTDPLIHDNSANKRAKSERWGRQSRCGIYSDNSFFAQRTWAMLRLRRGADSNTLGLIVETDHDGHMFSRVKYLTNYYNLTKYFSH